MVYLTPDSAELKQISPMLRTEPRQYFANQQVNQEQQQRVPSHQHIEVLGIQTSAASGSAPCPGVTASWHTSLRTKATFAWCANPQPRPSPVSRGTAPLLKVFARPGVVAVLVSSV